MPIPSNQMNTQIQPGTLNSLNSSFQVITGKPFQGQITAATPQMIASNKPGVLQPGQAGQSSNVYS